MRASSGQWACLRPNSTLDQLACLNDSKARLYLPVTVFLALLILVGTMGNAMVCLVYWRRRSRVSSHYFILSLAILDLITCLVGMPTEIADLVLPFTFDSPVACKVLRFLHSTTIIASSTILIEVAFDRYYRICQLGRQFTPTKARLLCVGAVLLGVLSSWPSCLIFGRKSVDIDFGGVVIHGTDCSTDDSMRGTIFPTIYYIFLFSLFGITLVFFTVLYSKIGLRIVSQNKRRAGSGSTSSRCPSTSSRKALFKAPSEKVAETSNSELSSEPEENSGTSGSSESARCYRPRPKLTSTSSANEDPFDEEEEPETKGDVFSHSKAHDKWIHPTSSSSSYCPRLMGAPNFIITNPYARNSWLKSSQRATIRTVNDSKEVYDTNTPKNSPDNEAVQSSQSQSDTTITNEDIDISADSFVPKSDTTTTHDESLIESSQNQPDSVRKEDELDNSCVSNHVTLKLATVDDDASIQNQTNDDSAKLIHASQRQATCLDTESNTSQSSQSKTDSLDTVTDFPPSSQNQADGSDTVTKVDKCVPVLSTTDFACEDECDNLASSAITVTDGACSKGWATNCSDSSCYKKSCTSEDDCDSCVGRLRNSSTSAANHESSEPCSATNADCRNSTSLLSRSNKDIHCMEEDDEEERPLRKNSKTITYVRVNRKLSQPQTLKVTDELDIPRPYIPKVRAGQHYQSPRPYYPKVKGRSSQNSKPPACHRQLRVGKTTTVLFAVTLAYILSFLPYLTVMVMRSVVKGLEEGLSPMGEVAYKLCVKSFFINNAINPIIYSFLNQAFRKDARDALGKLCRRGSDVGLARDLA